ncbi:MULTISPECIES: hypothetical protein [unclassified Microcoleus]|uniref:hypothetical protein n=1 Tax=unclassified Microcoleus TaxID=2642155 RepID=UPI002FCF7D67
MNIEHSLISTALLALQQSKKIQFDMNCTDSGKSGFWFKGYANEDQNNEIMVEVLIYMDSTSATGYGVQVDVLDDETITIFNKPIESFQQFQLIFASEFIQEVFDSHHN